MRWWEWGWGGDLRIRSGCELAWPLRLGPRSPLAPAVASCWDARGAHVTRGTTPNFAGPCGYSKEGGDGDTDSDQLHWSHRMWMELAGRGRGGGIFRSLRSRASGRRLVAAGRGSSLLTSTQGAIHGRLRRQLTSYVFSSRVPVSAAFPRRHRTGYFQGLSKS